MKYKKHCLKFERNWFCNKTEVDVWANVFGGSKVFHYPWQQMKVTRASVCCSCKRMKIKHRPMKYLLERNCCRLDHLNWCKFVNVVKAVSGDLNFKSDTQWPDLIFCLPLEMFTVWSSIFYCKSIPDEVMWGEIIITLKETVEELVMAYCCWYIYLYYSFSHSWQYKT